MKRFDDDELHAVTDVIESGELSRFFSNFNGGKMVRGFEFEFANYLGVQHAVSVSNGTVALELALQAMGVGPKSMVITTPLTFIATATAIKRVGATPVFVDIDPNTLNIDPDSLENYLECHNTDSDDAVIPVPLFGHPTDMHRIMRIAKKYKLKVLEDTAQSLGAEIGYQKLGSFGDCSTFSFQESKNITCLGEGGMIATNDNILANKARHLRNHGNVYGDTEMSIACTNARLTEAQAAFGSAQMLKVDRFNKIHKENALALIDAIDESKMKCFYSTLGEISSIFSLIPMYLTDECGLTREEFVVACKREGLSKGVPGENVGSYSRLVCDNKTFQYPTYSVQWQGLPVANKLKEKIIILDLHRWSKTVDDMKQYAETINNILNRGFVR